MKKTILIICFVCGFFAFGYGSYRGFLAFIDYSRERFSETHTLMAGDDSDDADTAAADEKKFLKLDSVVNPLKTIKDAVSWKLLAMAKLGVVKGSKDNAMQAIFLPDIKKLDHDHLIIQGFMFPLDASERQTHFVLSPYPVSCPYCLPAGPNELVEVYSKKPVKFSYEPIALKGEFELLTSSDQIKDGMLYRLENAEIYKN